MKNYLNRITMSDEVAEKAYAGEYEDMTTFTYINVKTGRKKTIGRRSIYDAILLAERRRNDKRYKNFEFHIG